MTCRLSIALLTCISVFGADLPQSVLSRSGQFIAHGRAASEASYPIARKSNFVPLEPELLVVSAERIKKAFLNTLKVPDRNSGRIYLVIRNDLSPETLINIASTRYNDGWTYRIDLPSRLDEPRLVRSVTHALLLDLANGSTATRSAELPLWLTEGFCRKLLVEIRPGYLLRPPTALFEPAWSSGGLFATYASLNLSSKSPLSDVTGSVDPLARVRQTFRLRSPFTFNDLSFKGVNEIGPEEFQIYQDSAQYLVHELLGMDHGPERLAAMIQSLPECWNWQTAFFHVYADRFSNMREVEKWWSLAQLDLEGKDNSKQLNQSASLDRLKLILVAETEVRTAKTNVPGHAQMNLQEMVQQCGFEDQRQILESKVQQLTLFEFHCEPTVLPIAEGYRSALLSYLNKRRAGSGAGVEAKLDPANRARLFVRDLIRQLEMLDEKRAHLAAGPISIQPATQSARR